MRLAVLAVCLLAGACSGGEKDVGTGVLDVTAAPTSSATPKQPPTQRPRPSREATQAPETFDVHIKGGQCTLGLCGFEPRSFEVTAGTTIVVHNDDPQRPRSWVSNDAESFDSGEIRPGGTYRFKTREKGRFPFRDGTAFYISGEMLVR